MKIKVGMTAAAAATIALGLSACGGSSTAPGVSTAPGGGAFGLWNAFPGMMLPVGGGRPIVWEGLCIGGIGVSGGTAEQDDELAEAGISATLAPGVLP